MRRVLAAALAVLALPAAAEAHTLTQVTAKRAARAYALEQANYVRPVPAVAIGDCYRRNVHAVVCRAYFGFSQTICKRNVLVTLDRAPSRTLRGQFVTQPRCF
jgi:hypothetical protein